MRGLRLAWIAPALATVTLLVAMGVVAAVWAGRQSDLTGVWSWFGPSQYLVALGSVLLGGIAFGVYALQRRREGQPLALLAIISLAVVAIALSLAAVARCLPNGDVLGAVWQTMDLFVGTSPAAFDLGVCGGSVPLAAQVARFAAMAAVFGTALALAAALAANQVDRLLNRFRRFDEVVVGVDDQAIPLIRTLVEWSSALAGGRKRAVVVLSLEGQEEAARAASEIGARVFKISAEPERSPHRTSLADLQQSTVEQLVRALAPFLTAIGRVAVHRIWIMDPDLGRALMLRQAVHKLLGSKVGSAPGSSERPVRVVVRADDTSAAARLRSDFIGEAAQPSSGQSDGPVLLDDAICLHEITAAQVVGRVARTMGPSDYALVVCDDTPLAQAIVTEIALRKYEDSFLARVWAEHQRVDKGVPHGEGVVPGDHPDDLLTGGKMPTKVVVVSPSASVLLANVLARLSPQGRDALMQRQAPMTSTNRPRAKGMSRWRRPSGAVHVVARDWRHVRARDLPKGLDLAFVVTQELGGDEDHLPGRMPLIARNRQVRTWVRSDSVDHRSWSLRNPGCEGFANDVLLRESLPDDLWTRVARLSHESFRRHWFEDQNPLRYPWWSPDESTRLPAQWRDDNIDQVRHLLVNTSRLGFKWVQRYDEGSRVVLESDQLVQLGEWEHERWCRVRFSQGWEQGVKNSEATPPTHPDLCDWRSLENKRKVVEQLEQLLCLLAVHGYAPVREGRAMGAPGRSR